MIALRPMQPDDEAHVFSSWMDHAVRSRAYSRYSRPYAFWLLRLVVRERLARGVVLVCCSSDDASVILGWACTGPGAVVHYVFVKPKARGNDIARKLLAHFAEGTTATSAMHEYDGKLGRWVARLPQGWTYDPDWVAPRDAARETA